MEKPDKLNILVVDDDEGDFVIMREYFSDIQWQDYHLDWVSDFEEALNIIKTNAHDVYFFDYRLGIRTGIDLLRQAIDGGCTAPIILLTGQGDHDVDLQAMKIGAADYLVKGEMSGPSLDRCVRYAIESKKMQNKLQVMLNDLQVAHEDSRRAEDTARAKSNFLANMSHEIRTPMNSILGFADLLGKTQLDKKQQTYLNTISSSGELLVNIIDDILDISKLESGNIILESAKLDLEAVILETFKMIVIRMKDNPFDTYIDIGDDVPNTVMGDAIRLKQVLVNLLGNAVKFTSKGDIGVIVRLEERNDETQEVRLRFIVKDTGIGIPKDKQKLVFQSFSQADETTTRKFGGTGLGLTISKAIIEKMGGKIWVESEEGKGSQFIFSVAFKRGEESDQTKIDQQVFELLKEKKVFIIDDNEIARTMINKFCKKIGLDVLGIVNSAQSALEEIERFINKKNQIPDLILCDLIMEHMDGFELTKQLRQKEQLKNAKYIAITADLLAEASHKANGSLFDAYITKPISLTDVAYSIKRIFTQNQEDKVIKDSRTSSGESKVFNFEGIKVLVADDSPPNRMLVQAYFEELKCECDFANDGQEAIDKIKTGSYDLCLMDLHMPVLGGMEATKIIRRDISQDIPIIALSAAVMEEDKKRAKEAGMNDFLTKPINIAVMADKILQYTKNRN